MSLEVLKTQAEQGNAESQYLLGRAFDEGTQTPRNLLEAISWYQKAANQGHLLASKALGIDVSKHTATENDTSNHRITKIYGPPGTGKTTKLIELIREELSAGVEPNMIGFFSFTNKATEEAKTRMAKEFPQFNINEDFPYFQTFHSLANQALQTKVTVISESQAREFDASVYIERTYMREGDESSLVVRVKHPVLDAATTSRSLKIPFEQYLKDLPSSQRWPINKWLRVPYRSTNNPISTFGISQCLAYNERYEAYKTQLGVIDFADMLDMAIINNDSLPTLKLLLIDEAQDLSPAQWDIANILIEKAEKTVVAGDDDQAICEAIGASSNHFIDLVGHEVVLDQSRRIPEGVHTYLTKLIHKLEKKNPKRKHKIWHPKASADAGEVKHFRSVHSFFEFLFPNKVKTSKNDVLIMFVTNSSLRNYSDYLYNFGISHYASNRLVGTGTPNVRLLTIWGAKGGQAHTTALITSSEMDVRMLLEDPRLEYVAHSRALHSFYYVGDYVGENIPAHSSESQIASSQAIHTNQSSHALKTESQKIPEPAPAPAPAPTPINFQGLVDKFAKAKRS